MFDSINEISTGGIVPSRWLREAAHDDIISSGKYKIQEANFQPASLDLSLGEKAYSLVCSFLPLTCSVETKLPELQISEIDIRDGAILERGRAYLIPLLEELRLPQGIRAKTNPKSSTGRLDIFTRVITDFSDQFDVITDGYEGRMYLEVFSRSFTVRVQTGLSLNQLRLFKGDPTCSPGELQEAHQSKPILFAAVGQQGQLTGPNFDNTIGLSVDLKGTSEGIGFRAKKNSALLDLSRVNHYDPADFWEPVFADGEERLILEPEEFYLLSSTESVGIPPEFAA
ncbi:MAG TPA: 2'-deoxycytidine 5'-triphosphate deaminase [Dehalococcoidia bacterium]|nr:2'-deoxycytidine 5'-triphosphate deaminase [Dehalococcoidia bacterium]